ncbi:MAG: 30S ribosomal protein S16 [Deltaproteobacteria bacterium]|nr:30S ribosomal protein S16 [Deltaproteobacteria bacterium]MBW1946852.1 30S ribosomal protein S16 [Deltaproteobacteria bacterium]MBW1966944.1 30S ribosomal protein S16 [Deltaproteobacteria bacterium]MBW2097412.1 30S ribosomal protein S16 [Deltaproteobacteria bacterium]
MAIRIRLTRRGRKKKPFYRVVAANSEAKRDGRFLEILGTYDPLKDPAVFKVDSFKLDKWLRLGARPTDTVRSLLKRAGHPLEPDQ